MWTYAEVEQARDLHKLYAEQCRLKGELGLAGSAEDSVQRLNVLLTALEELELVQPNLWGN